MKKIHYLLAGVLAAVAVLLVGLGILRMVRVYEQYRADMLSYESRHLNSIISTSARGMDWMISGYLGQTQMLVNRIEFREAEEEYFRTGNTEPMQELASRPDFLAIGMKCMLVVYDQYGQVLAATDGEFPDYRIADVFMADNVVLRAQNGAYWLVFSYYSNRGLRYELALSVQSVFSAHAAPARIGRHGYLFLMDVSGSFLAVSTGGETMTFSMEAVKKQFPDADMAAIGELAASQNDLPGQYTIYNYPWEDMEEGPYTPETLVVTCPVPVGDSCFIMGAAISFQEFNAILASMLDEIIGMSLLVIAGAGILMLLFAWFMIRNRRDALQMASLKEKAELMEEINRQQQSLQHNERLQQLGVMTSGIAHEFNNLMTPIMGQSLLLLEQLADEEESPRFESALDIYEASEKARTIIKGMSSMSKKNVDMSFRTLDIAALLQKTMNLAAMAKNSHIQQEFLAGEEPVFVSGNEQLLTQAFMNLFINGYQAMGDEGKLMVIMERESRSGHEYVRVEVRDSGPGLPQSNPGQIYEEFYTTKGEHGTGLGLVICRKILETHKGTISASNHPEGGAVFTVRLPVAELEDE